MTDPTNQPETPPPSGEPPAAGQPAPPPPPPMPYAGQAPPPVAPRNGMGTTALVLAIAGLLFCWTVVGGVILGIIAIILGIVGRGRVNRGEATNGGVSIAGIVLGALALIAGLVFIPLYIWVFSFFGGDDFVDCLSNAGNDTAAQNQCADQFQQHLENKFSVTPTP